MDRARLSTCGTFWDFSVPTPMTTARAQWPPGAPLMPSRFGPKHRHAPWQSSGPNELISQLEALHGGTGAAREEAAVPEGDGGRNKGSAGRGARYEKDLGVE